jgi:hypothetical protein
MTFQFAQRQSTAEQRIRRLRSGFGRVSRPAFRTLEARRRRRSFSVMIVVIVIIVAALSAILYLSPWSATETLRHLAAAPNCALARAVGLAAAHRGNPGYWPMHDADNDGIACEPWTRWE